MKSYIMSQTLQLPSAGLSQGWFSTGQPYKAGCQEDKWEHLTSPCSDSSCGKGHSKETQGSLPSILFKKPTLYTT